MRADSVAAEARHAVVVEKVARQLSRSQSQVAIFAWSGFRKVRVQMVMLIASVAM